MFPPAIVYSKCRNVQVITSFILFKFSPGALTDTNLYHIIVLFTLAILQIRK
jgi:hypothetical protein